MMNFVLTVAWENVNKNWIEKSSKDESSGEEGTWWRWINKINLRKSLENLASLTSADSQTHNSTILAYVQADKPWSIIYFKYSLNI